MNIGIILAAGKGTRYKSQNSNKTVTEFYGKPLVSYGVDLFLDGCDKTVVVVGKYYKGVVEAIGENPKIEFVLQKKRLGTGHAVKVAINDITKRNWKPERAYVGMGDHMMFYTPKIIQELAVKLENDKTAISLVTCEYDKPDDLRWGRIVRKNNGNVAAIVEQKDATTKQRKIKEVSPALYCFRWDFLKESIKRIKKSKSGEYYLTDLVAIAVESGEKVCAVKVPFENVGVGVNTREDLRKSEKLYADIN